MPVRVVSFVVVDTDGDDVYETVSLSEAIKWRRSNEPDGSIVRRYTARS